MKKINELKQERSEVITKMEEISKSEQLTEEQRSAWKGFDDQVKSIDDQIQLLERQEQLNLNNITKMENTETYQPIAVRFRDWLTDAIKNGSKESFRVEPMLSTSNSDILNKTVACPDVLTSPAESFLRTLGVTMWTGLNGQVYLPYMDQETASFVAEATCNGDASMNILDNSIAPRRITNSQTVTRELLAQTNPCVYQSILDNLVTGIWNGVLTDAFDVLDTDAATQITTTGTTVTYVDVLNLEASLGCFDINAKYVSTPTGKATLKQLATVASVAGPAWMGNELNGTPAYSTCFANAHKLYYGDWSKFVVGQWGGLEIIVDPFTYAKCGKITVTVLGLFDSGTINKNAFAILDASSL